MTVLFEKNFNGILIRAERGFKDAAYKDGVLTVNGDYQSYDYFRTADIYLDENIIQIGIGECFNGEFRYRSNYYVMDYGVYNLRRYDDMSVIKNLERIEPKILPKKDRHLFELFFGSSNEGKEKLGILMKEIKENFETTCYDTPVRLRNWDQRSEILISPKITKSTFAISTEMIGEFADFIESKGYTEESKIIKGQRAKAVFERINKTIDFRMNFRKKKKPKKEA